MNPKEKAKELVDKMGISKSYGVNYTGGDDVVMYKNQYAKECALIAVEQAILYHPFPNEPDERDVKFKEYWEEVKKEIENL